MKILLINPPRAVPQRADFPPMGLCYIAAVLKPHFPVKTIDAAHLSWAQLAEQLRQEHPTMVGISCWTIERGQAFKTAKLVKDLFPEACVVMGGHHATAFPGQMFSEAGATAVALGEGEQTAVELFKALAGRDDISAVKGICYLGEAGPVWTSPRELDVDLDALPFPCYEDIDFDHYNGLPELSGRAAAIITSRGCPYDCVFCSASTFWHRRWRYRSAENVVQEIAWLKRDFGIRNFMFFDDNFAVRKERAIDICRRLVEDRLGIRWASCTHVNHVDEEVLAWMRKAGCYRIDYGVESGSPKVLANIKKGTTVEQVKRAFRLTWQAGIYPRAYLMVGNPGDDEESIDQTVRLMREIKPYNAPSGQILWVLPDTQIYGMAKDRGVISDDFWVGGEDVVYYTGEHSAERLARLRNRLMLGLARNRRSPLAYLEYVLRKLYYAHPSLRRFYHTFLARRKFIFRWFRSGDL